MLDNAALNDLLEKTAQACGTADASGPSDRAGWAEPPARMQELLQVAAPSGKELKNHSRD